jgi:hypothetical protein
VSRRLTSAPEQHTDASADRVELTDARRQRLGQVVFTFETADANGRGQVLVERAAYRGLTRSPLPMPAGPAVVHVHTVNPPAATVLTSGHWLSPWWEQTGDLLPGNTQTSHAIHSSVLAAPCQPNHGGFVR